MLSVFVSPFASLAIFDHTFTLPMLLTGYFFYNSGKNIVNFRKGPGTAM